MAKQKIVQWCQTCRGSGVIISDVGGNPTEAQCPQCNGTGKIDWGYLKVEQEP